MLKFKEYAEALKNREFSDFLLFYVIDMVSFEALFLRYGFKELEKSIKESSVELKKESEDTEGLKEVLDTLIEGLKAERDFYKNNMCIVKLNTSFENYLYKFAHYWLEKRLGILDECEVKFKEIRILDKGELIFQKIDDFIHNNLFRQNYEEALLTINKRFGTNIICENKEIDFLNLFYDLRNVIVHSNGRIDLRFKAKYPDAKFEIDNKININDEFVELISGLLLNIVLRIDSLLLKQFPESKFDLKKFQQTTFTPFELKQISLFDKSLSK